MANELFDLGMIGMGVMGRNLLLNMADHGFKVLGYNKSAEKIAKLEADATPGTTVKGTTTLEGFRRIGLNRALDQARCTNGDKSKDCFDIKQ